MSDPGTWGTYQEALGSAGGRVGFVLTEGDDVSCIDLNAVLTESGHPLPAVLELIDATPDVFAVEASPSDQGIHIWHHGVLGPGTTRTEGALQVEQYSRGCFIAWTGRVPAWWRTSMSTRRD